MAQQRPKPRKRDGAFDAADSAARALGVRMVGVAIDGEPYSVQVPGPPGAVLLDGSAPDLYERLEAEGGFDDAQVARLWLEHARALGTAGVALRKQGRLASAYCHQRVALFVAARAGNVAGAIVSVKNVWVIRDGLRDILVRALGPDRSQWQTEEGRRALAALRWADATIPTDAGVACRLVSRLVDAVTADAGAPRDVVLRLRQALYRVARMAGDIELRRAALERLLESAAASGSRTMPLLAAIDEVGELDMTGVLVAAGLVDPGLDQDGASAAWSLYQSSRDELARAEDIPLFLEPLVSAYHQLNALRADVTRAGGGFGHELSYAISSLLQVVGGDLASLYERAGCPEDALAVLETIRARAMADWMGRTHAVWATPRWVRAAVSPISGSINGSDAAGLHDIHRVSAELCAPLLYYLRQDHEDLAILVTPAGEVASARLGDVRSRLADVTRALHLGGSLSRGGVRDLQAARADEVERPPLDAALRALHDALLPPQVRKVLDSSGERVVIVPDPSLDGVPFAALRTPEGTYLIESHELLFLPSATAWLSIAAGARVSTWQRARRAAPVAPLVGGITRFGRSQLHSADGRETARLGDLPGAAAEAKAVSRLLGVKPRLDAGVTTRAVFQASGADVVHLATHGYLDEAHPRASCLVLSDGPLLADELYRSDRGLRAGLVVLSACQTGLGGAHPDSTIGLANAFMIAGAQSVVSTLWRIPDEVTAAMMTAFYARLVDGDNVAKALRAAQRDVLDEPRTSHPVCWAAFRLTGRPENPLSH